MNIYLTALGWVEDPEPKGNRLRWYYPVDALDSEGHYLGLPEKIILERAPVEGQEIPAPNDGSGYPPFAPSTWWDSLGDRTLSAPQNLSLDKASLDWVLSEPVQAVRFTYVGNPAMIRVYDSARDKLLIERIIQNNEFFVFGSSSIDKISIFTNLATFKDLRTLNLFAPRNLKWEKLTEIQVGNIVNYSLEDVRPRHHPDGKMDKAKWSELVQLTNDCLASTPASKVEGQPTLWEAFSFLLHLRWEYAVLAGQGFVDGPHDHFPEMDAYWNILNEPPGTAMAYRVKEVAGRVGPSNIIVCPNTDVLGLKSPKTPVTMNETVTLSHDAETNKNVFVSEYALHWENSDAIAIGVEVEEQIGQQSAPVEILTYYTQSKVPNDPPNKGSLLRTQEVIFYDIRLRARARARDGWDRFSDWSDHSPWKQPILLHDPPAPPLESAWLDSDTGKTYIRRHVSTSNIKIWKPDVIVASDPQAKVVICRRKKGPGNQPAEVNVTVEKPTPLSKSQWRTTVSGASDLQRFHNGTLSVGQLSLPITRISGNKIDFSMADSNFDKGSAILYQSPNHPDLWEKVAEVSVHSLPDVIDLIDPVPAPVDTSDVLSYHARLSFLTNMIGPPSNNVQVIRIPDNPDPPPPFSVEFLGEDFYHRTMVEVTFTTPVSSGLFTVWWANGHLQPSQFESVGVPGLLRAQSPHKSKILFDVLPLPSPRNVDRDITIGVQQVTESGGKSAFAVVPVTLSPLNPA
jgi:hypothetical protein